MSCCLNVNSIDDARMGVRDWTKMEFMRGDIHAFMDALAGYKSMISVALGTVTMLVVMHPSHAGSTDVITERIPPRSSARLSTSITRWSKTHNTNSSSSYDESKRI
jgi:hypothetical protein